MAGAVNIVKKHALTARAPLASFHTESGGRRVGRKANVDESLRYLKALVVLQAATLEQLGGGQKPEVLLDRAGIGIKEIAELTGRSYAAVAQTLSRERRRSRTKPKDGSE